MTPRTLGLLTGLALLLLPAAATASNMGFALQLNIAPAGTNLSFLSLPYLYNPTTAEALCQDLLVPGVPNTVASVRAWDDTSSTFLSHTCGSASNPNNFSLTEGIAYGIVNASAKTIAGLVVGAHDDAFTYSIAPTSGGNLTWISIPYHHNIPDVAGTAGVVDAEDLCESIGPNVKALMRWDAPTSLFVTYACGSVFDTPFPITMPNGYGLINAPGQTIAWQPPHY